MYIINIVNIYWGQCFKGNDSLPRAEHMKKPLFTHTCPALHLTQRLFLLRPRKRWHVDKALSLET